MMYGKDKGQMSASTMRALSKAKPMVNAGAKPVEMPKSKKKPKVLRPVRMIDAEVDPRGLAGFSTKNPMGNKMSSAMDRGVRKALRMPPAK